jgi:uncharacterized protein (TIGR02284 family)
METQKRLAEVLNDLVKINHDRTAGYEKAANQANDADLKALFSKYAGDSRKYANDLSAAAGGLGKDTADDTTTSGKIYRTWMDVKAVFGGDSREGILESCEYGEDAAQKAYDEALASDAEMSAAHRQLIMDQKAELKQAHDHVKQLRNMAHAAN